MILSSSDVPNLGQVPYQLDQLTLVNNPGVKNTHMFRRNFKVAESISEEIALWSFSLGLLKLGCIFWAFFFNNVYSYIPGPS